MTKPSATPESALVVVEPSTPVTYNLDEWPESKFNRLIPTQTIRIPTDLLVPVIQVVQLSEADKDLYSSADVPNGHKAPTARGLNKLATAAGVSFHDERRVDDGSDPNVIGVTVVATMMLPTGQRIEAPGTKWVNLDHQSWASDAQRKKYRSFFYEHVSTRARNRAIRALLSLRSSYPVADLAKPFAVVSYAPNMNHPAVRERMLDSVAPRVSQLYGPDTKALGSGEPVQTLREIDADDEPLNQTLGRPEFGPDKADEPDWFGAPAGAPAPVVVERMAAVLFEKASNSGLAGPATDPQKKQLQAILGPLGIEAVTTGVELAFGIKKLADISAAQAQAIIACAVDDEFADHWLAMVKAAAA